MDDFSNEYKGNRVFTHASGTDAGSWVGNYSVLAINDQSKLYSALHGKVTGAFSSIGIATDNAAKQARQRIDDFLLQRERYATEDLRARFVAHTKDLRKAHA